MKSYAGMKGLATVSRCAGKRVPVKAARCVKMGPAWESGVAAASGLAAPILAAGAGGSCPPVRVLITGADLNRYRLKNKLTFSRGQPAIDCSQGRFAAICF